MMRRRLVYAWRTDKGRVRSRNEDAVAVAPDLGLVVVADGIGGARAGDVASRLATEIIPEQFRVHGAPLADAERCRLFAMAAIEQANVAIWHKSRVEPQYSGMGTTVVVGLVGPSWLAFANVGDSRLYRLREGWLDQLSRDHSLIQDVVDQGLFDSRADARRYGIGENILTRALGAGPGVGIASEVAGLESGDLYLFCTDGLTGMVREEQLRALLAGADEAGLEETADALVRLANDQGGVDNITLALLQVGEPIRPGTG